MKSSSILKKQNAWTLKQYRDSQQPFVFNSQMTTVALLLILGASITAAAANKTTPAKMTNPGNSTDLTPSNVSAVCTQESGYACDASNDMSQSLLYAANLTNITKPPVSSPASETIKTLPENEVKTRSFDKTIITDALKPIFTSPAIKYASNKFRKILKNLYNLSPANARHIDYALATNLKFVLVPENPNSPGNFEYIGLDHTIKIPVPHTYGKFKANVYGLDEFEEAVFLRVLHEVQHGNTAIMNSKDCQPVLETQQILKAKTMPLILPRNPKEILKQVAVVQDYVLNHVAKILPADGKYIDYREQYEIGQAEEFFKNTSNKPGSEEAKKELAYLQYLLKDYHPRRAGIMLDAGNLQNWIAEGKIAKLQKGEVVPFNHHGYEVFIDHIEERHGQFYANGYAVKNPKDKVRAFVADTLYQRDRMPKLYESRFAQSNYPLNKRAAEVDGHAFEMTDLAAFEKIYDELAATHAKTRESSTCKPGV